MNRLIIRTARKTSHISNKLLGKAIGLTGRIENKADRLLNGVDYTMKVEESIPFEKIYYNSIPHITPLNPALPAVGSKPAVVLLIPTLDDSSFFGGTATAIIVAAKLALKKNRSLKIVQTLKSGSIKGIEDLFKREGITLPISSVQSIDVSSRKYNIYGYISMHPEDIFIASAWWDAHLLSQLPLVKPFIYLIQDFEPIFYNNSDSYILAEETYKGDRFVALCNTKLMYEFMKNRNYPTFLGKKAFWFEPAVSRANSGLAVKKKQTEKKNLFIYGRPNVHRNLFFTALDSLDYAIKAGFIEPSGWNFYMAGQDNIPDIQLSGGAKIQNKGKMTMSEYVKFSKTIDLAVSPMMAPHPNYPTLEFASIGSAVVTTKYANKQDLSRYCKNIIVSEIGIESIAGAIKLAASSPYDERVSNLKTTTIPSDWDESISHVLDKIDRLV